MPSPMKFTSLAEDRMLGPPVEPLSVERSYPTDLTVVMPCLNEERTVGKCVATALRAFHEMGVVGEVLVVDNGSTDESAARANQAGATLLSEPRRGYGSALRRGCDEARGRFILMGDCDDSYDFSEMGRFIGPLRGGADLVIGNRFAGGIEPGAMPWLHRWIGNPGLSWLLTILCKTRIADSQCGMRAFTREAYDKMRLRTTGMEFASEMVVKSAAARLNVEEVPVTLRPDGRVRPPHLRSFRDGWRHLRLILSCCPVFLFILPGGLMAVSGMLAIGIAVISGYGEFGEPFGPNFLYGGSMLAISGFHVLLLGLVATLHAHRSDPAFRGPRFEKALRMISVERGLLVGTVLASIGATVAMPVLSRWAQALAVPAPGNWILGGTLIMLGVETIFASFLVETIDSPHRRRDGR